MIYSNFGHENLHFVEIRLILNNVFICIQSDEQSVFPESTEQEKLFNIFLLQFDRILIKCIFPQSLSSCTQFLL